MLHALLLSWGLASCNVYEGDRWCRDQLKGGYVAQVALNEGYGLPLPVLLSDLPVDGSATEVTEAALQDAVAHNGYVIVQATNPVIIYNGIKVPSGHFLEGALCPTMVTLKGGYANGGLVRSKR